MNLIDIHLEIFEGPLDLLLYLVKKNNYDIYNIPVSKITEEYLQYLEVMKELNLDIAGDFLVMASTLIQLKAKSLMPKKEDETEEGQDPKEKIRTMLEEYQKYKTATQLLVERFNKYKDVFYRGSPVFQTQDKHLDVEMFALIEAVKKAFERLAKKHEIEAEDVPIESRIEKILKVVSEKKWITLDEIFKEETKLRGIITCFLAVLELIKLGKIGVTQDTPFSEIKIYLIENTATA